MGIASGYSSLQQHGRTGERYREGNRGAIQAFYDAGCRSLQLDDCTWGRLCDKNYWEARQQEGVDVQEIAKLYAHVNQEAVKGFLEDLIITTHVCRGNYHSLRRLRTRFGIRNQIVDHHIPLGRYRKRIPITLSGGFLLAVGHDLVTEFPRRHVGELLEYPA